MNHLRKRWKSKKPYVRQSKSGKLSLVPAHNQRYSWQAGQAQRERSNINYHLKAARLNKRSIRTLHHFRGFWTAPTDAQYKMLNELSARLSKIYGISTPKVTKDHREVYYWNNQTIGLPVSPRTQKVSMLSFLHEYRHHMQRQKIEPLHPDVEEDARAWSMSMFHSSKPVMFRKAWKDDKLWFMPEYKEDYEDYLNYIRTLRKLGGYHKEPRGSKRTMVPPPVIRTSRQNCIVK